MARRTYAGASVATTLAGSLTAGVTTATLTSGGGTSLPNAVAGPFVITVNVGGATEEKILVGARTGDNLSSLTRGYDGTTAAAHAAGESVRHTISAVDLDEANGHINDTTLDQHTQYAKRGQGLAANVGAASRAGRLYIGTDTESLFADDGTAVHEYLSKTQTNAAYTAKRVVHLNVKDYGAVGDGTTNDTAAIQSAIDAASTGTYAGVPVFLPVGTYKIAGALNVNTGITFYGLGVRSKIVQSTLTSDFFSVGDGTNTVYNAVFRDFAVTSASTQTAGWVFHVRRGARCTFERIAMQDAQDFNAGKNLFNGIWFDNFDDCELVNCQILGSNNLAAAGVGVQCNGKLDGTFGAELQLTGGNKISGFDNGIHIAGAAGGVYIDETAMIINNTNARISKAVTALANREIFFGSQAILDFCQLDGLYIEGLSVAHLDCTGTWIASAGQGNIARGGVNIIAAQISDAVFNFSGSRIYSNKGFGLAVNGAARIILDGCSIQYNGQNATDPTLGSGICLLAGNVDLTVTDSQIHNNGNATPVVGYGVYVAGTGNRLVLNDNIFRNNIVDAFNKPSLDTSVTARDNVGLVTSNSGSTQVVTSAAFIDVTHGLYNTPQTIQITPFNSDAADRYWVSNVGATTFRINLTAAPAANKAFYWRAVTGLGY